MKRNWLDILFVFLVISVGFVLIFPVVTAWFYFVANFWERILR